MIFGICVRFILASIKGSYYDEIYECSPKKVEVFNFKKNSIKLNGFVITKFKYLN